MGRLVVAQANYLDEDLINNPEIPDLNFELWILGPFVAHAY
jgi:hypothetical protein